MGKRRIKWLPGDNFLVPLEDGTYGRGQVLSYELHALNSALCAFSSIRHENVPAHLDTISEDNLIAILFVTRDLLDSGRWHVVNNGPIILWEKFVDIRRMRDKGFVGVAIEGSRIVANFLSAYHKLVPWNVYFDPEYFDKLLISPDRKPANLLLK
jgi:hypothetical protein